MEKQELTILEMNVLRLAGAIFKTEGRPKHENMALKSALEKLSDNQVIMQMELGVEYNSVEHKFEISKY